MSLQDLLKKLDLKIPTPQIKALNGVKIASDNTDSSHQQIIYKPTINILQISNPQTLPKDKKQLIQTIIKDYFEEGKIIVDEEVNKTLKTLTISANDGDTKQTLLFYQDKLSKEDLIILELALYLRREFKVGDRTRCRIIKQEIVDRYGRRGANISNLITAGYLESDITPLFEELSKTSETNRETYQIIFDDLVNNFPTAIFINANMTDKEIVREITSQITTNKKHGINYLVVHGIGEKNIQTIERAIIQIEQEIHFTSKDVDKKHAVIRVKLMC